MPSQPFIKMQGAGNDYVFLDEFQHALPPDLPAFARSVSDRNFGVGSDGLICLAKPTAGGDVRMLMYNADGSSGAMCGNGVRCIALWMMLQNRCGDSCRVETVDRTVTVNARDLDRANQRGHLQVDMGAPAFDPSTAQSEESISFGPDSGLPQLDYRFTRVSMGNPHAVLFVEQLNDSLVCEAGRLIEQHKTFRDRTNVEWVVVNGPTELTVRVWERGSGETLACGSGACAAVVAAVLRQRCPADEPVTVHMPGGDLTIQWSANRSVLMTGPAQVSFTGELPRQA